ncbi:MAG: RNA polymerase sigma-70 factor [Chitinophagaceae bacterium]|nr:RNA polymerase sigma-70 factor [Chitinophagaceae bacterium]
MSCNRPINESTLLCQLADGNREAFRILYDNYRDKLFYYALRLTGSKQAAEDILQEVFIKVWMGRNTMADIRSFEAWLFTLAKHKIINGLRRLSLEHTILAEIRKDLHAHVDSTIHAIDYNETARALRTAIEQLPPQQKIIYRLRQEQGLKNDEIAHQLNISPLTVKKHISQASRALRCLVEKQIGLTVSLLLATLFRIFL